MYCIGLVLSFAFYISYCLVSEAHLHLQADSKRRYTAHLVCPDSWGSMVGIILRTQQWIKPELPAIESCCNWRQQIIKNKTKTKPCKSGGSKSWGKKESIAMGDNCKEMQWLFLCATSSRTRRKDGSRAAQATEKENLKGHCRQRPSSVLDNQNHSTVTAFPLIFRA